VFEESIVDFFETADTNKDGVLDYNDFYTVSKLLQIFTIESSNVYNIIYLSPNPFQVRSANISKGFLISFLLNVFPLQLLVSPMVSTRVYSNQMEELLQLYEDYSTGGLMTMEQFGVVAKTLLIMIYQNAYPDVVSPRSYIFLSPEQFSNFNGDNNY
jgi:hypothetical protein